MAGGRGKAAKPPPPKQPTLSPEEAEQQARRAFAAQAVEAIKALELRQKALPQRAVAERAYNKLLFDFPDVTPEELQALAAELRQSVGMKTGHVPFALTNILLANVVEGARGPAKASAGSSETAAASPAAPSSAAAAAAAARPPPTAAQQQLQLAYQQLYCALFLRLVSHLLLVPEAEASMLLQGYSPRIGGAYSDGEEDEGGGDSAARQQFAEQLRTNGIDAAAEAALAAALGPPPAAASPPASAAPASATSCTVVEVAPDEPRFAEVQDDDEFVYEAIEEPSCSRGNGSNGGSAHQRASPASAAGLVGLSPPPQPPPPDALHAGSTNDGSASGASDELLIQKLLHIASHVDYGCVSCEALWQPSPSPQQPAEAEATSRQQASPPQPETWQDVLLAVRTAGVHCSALRLQPLLHAYVALVAERLLAAPVEVSHLHGLWQALGIKDMCAAPRPGPGRAAGAKAGGGAPLAPLLPSEASLAFSLVANVASQLHGPQARGKLWRQVNDTLLPVLARCLDDVACCPPALGDQQLAAALLLSDVLAFYLLHPAPGSKPGQQLLSFNVPRSLAVLFARHHTTLAAQHLRLVTLLAAATSPDVCAWLAAVPDVQRALSSAVFQLEGVCAPHGAVWQLLLSRGAEAGSLVALLSSMQQLASPSCSAGGASAGTANGEAAPAASRAAAAPSQALQLERLHSLLQLLHQVHAASQGALVWGSVARSALAAVAAQLRGTSSALLHRHQHAAPPPPHAGTSESPPRSPNAPGAATSSLASSFSGQHINHHNDDDDDDDDDDDPKVHSRVVANGSSVVEAAVAAVPPSSGGSNNAPIQAQCVKLLKELLTVSGGNSKAE